MPLDDRVKAYLWDIREAAREIHGFMRGVKFHQYEANKMLRYAVERQLHVIGEASNHVAPQFRKQHPEINWKRLVELRNVIAHEYGETLLNRTWLAATDGLIELIQTLDGLLTDDTKE
jgi:uncharacterized protein with HEPN domain